MFQQSLNRPVNLLEVVPTYLDEALDVPLRVTGVTKVVPGFHVKVLRICVEVTWNWFQVFCRGSVLEVVS